MKCNVACDDGFDTKRFGNDQRRLDMVEKESLSTSWSVRALPNRSVRYKCIRGVNSVLTTVEITTIFKTLSSRISLKYLVNLCMSV